MGLVDDARHLPALVPQTWTGCADLEDLRAAGLAADSMMCGELVGSLSHESTEVAQMPQTERRDAATWSCIVSLPRMPPEHIESAGGNFFGARHRRPLQP